MAEHHEVSRPGRGSVRVGHLGAGLGGEPLGALGIQVGHHQVDRATGAPPAAGERGGHVPRPYQPDLHSPGEYGATASGLVEEAFFDEPGPLFGGDLDVPGGEQEDLVGDPLHATVERVCEPRGEVDQAL